MTTREATRWISDGMKAAVIGQETVIERLMIALLADGHVLMEGLPGVAKTLSIKTLSNLIQSTSTTESRSERNASMWMSGCVTRENRR